MAASTAERKITCYPKPNYYQLIVAYAEVKEISESKAGSEAIKNFIDNLPPGEKKRVQEIAKRNQSKNSY